MKFKLVFDKGIYNKQMDLLFDLAWKKKIAYYKNSQYLGLILILIGFPIIFNRPNIFGIGYVLVFFGLSNFLPFIYYYFKIKYDYKKFDIAKTKEIEINNDLQNFSLELTDKSLLIKAHQHLKDIQWEEFSTYLIKEDNIILITKDYQPLILSEIEVGEENFKKIISFVEEKIKKVL